MMGDFVHQLPGNVQDLMLPGPRAAFQSPHCSTSTSGSGSTLLIVAAVGVGLFFLMSRSKT
jgi:hypothetical protein